MDVIKQHNYLRLKCCMEYREWKITSSGSYKYTVGLENKLLLLRGFPPVFNKPRRKTGCHFCICCKSERNS
jgi:hypothetical protein